MIGLLKNVLLFCYYIKVSDCQLDNKRRSSSVLVFSAAILGFTRARGEFGATVIVAGNTPNEKQKITSAIYSA